MNTLVVIGNTYTDIIQGKIPHVYREKGDVTSVKHDKPFLIKKLRLG